MPSITFAVGCPVLTTAIVAAMALSAMCFPGTESRIARSVTSRFSSEKRTLSMPPSARPL